MKNYKMKPVSNRIKTFNSLLCLLFLSFISLISSAQQFPEKADPPKLVNDYTQTLEGEETAALERKLVAFNDSTSTQISVVLIQTLEGYPIGDYAFQLGEKWGIGQKGKNNGLLVLISLKDRKMFIATGYGLEGSITDAASKRIIETILRPAFRNQQYYEGLDEATNTLMSLCKGEYTADQYVKKGNKFPLRPLLIILFIILVIGFYKVKKTMQYASMNHVSFFAAWMLLNALSSRSSGSWNDFSSGRGGFGGGNFGGDSGGSGFGGFGGGSFGGGGAGGDW